MELPLNTTSSHNISIDVIDEALKQANATFAQIEENVTKMTQQLNQLVINREAVRAQSLMLTELRKKILELDPPPTLVTAQ